MELKDVKKRQPIWFSKENKRFFGDISYRVLHGGITGDAYLVRNTYGWSDMFGRPKRSHWRINKINQETCEIKSLIHEEFETLDDVKEWLRFN